MIPDILAVVAGICQVDGHGLGDLGTFFKCDRAIHHDGRVFSFNAFECVIGGDGECAHGLDGDDIFVGPFVTCGGTGFGATGHEDLDEELAVLISADDCLSKATHLASGDQAFVACEFGDVTIAVHFDGQAFAHDGAQGAGQFIAGVLIGGGGGVKGQVHCTGGGHFDFLEGGCEFGAIFIGVDHFEGDGDVLGCFHASPKALGDAVAGFDLISKRLAGFKLGFEVDSFKANGISGHAEHHYAHGGCGQGTVSKHFHGVFSLVLI